MSDLGARLRVHVDAAAPPIDLATLVNQLSNEGSIAVVARVRRRIPNWVFAVATAVLVLVVIGGAALLLTSPGTTDPVDTPPPAETTSWNLDASDLASGWSRIGADDQVGAFAASEEDGLLAVGFREQGPGGGLPVWHADGPDADWASIQPFDSQPNLYITDVAAGGPGFVAVGNNISSGLSQVWISPDGSAWEWILDSDLPSGSCAALSEIAGNAVAVVAVGCDGGGDGAVVSSANGVEWISYTVPFSSPALHVVAGESGFLVTGDPRELLWSADGMQWIEVAIESAPSADPTWSLETPTAVGPAGLLLAGGTIDGRPMVWTSTDHGRHWSESEIVLPVAMEGRPMMVLEVAHTPFGYVAVGLLDVTDQEAFEELGDEATGFILHSSDGQVWSGSELEDAPPFSEFSWTDQALFGTFFGYGTWEWAPPST